MSFLSPLLLAGAAAVGRTSASAVASGARRASNHARPNTTAFSAAPTNSVRRRPTAGISQKAAHSVPAIAPAVLIA